MTNSITTTTAPAPKLITIRITDESGHTTLEQLIDDAIATVRTEVFARGKWAFVGATSFQFEATSDTDVVGIAQDSERLRVLLQDNDVVTLTGALVGGQPCEATEAAVALFQAALKQVLPEVIDTLAAKVLTVPVTAAGDPEDDFLIDREVLSNPQAFLDTSRDLLAEFQQLQEGETLTVRVV